MINYEKPYRFLRDEEQRKKKEGLKNTLRIYVNKFKFIINILIYFSILIYGEIYFNGEINDMEKSFKDWDSQTAEHL